MSLADYRTEYVKAIARLWRESGMARPSDIHYNIHFTEPTHEREDMIARKSPNKDGISLRDDPSQYVSANGNVIVSRDAAAAYLTVEVGNERIVSSGGAKRNKGDAFDFEIGANLAIGRALKAAGEEFERRAWEKVAPPRYVPKGEVTIYFTDEVAPKREVCGVCGMKEDEMEAWATTPRKYVVGMEDFAKDPVEPTLAELEREEAEERYRESIDRTDPDAEGNYPSGGAEGYEKRLSLYDRIKELWA